MPPTIDELPAPPAGAQGWPWTLDDGATLAAPESDGPWPRIGIVTPSYNQGGFIEETIRSVLLQGYPALSYRIRDGGSDDSTLEILRKYEPWLSGWESGPDAGQSDAINRGIATLDCDVVAWLNSDDLLEPGALLEVGRHLRSHPDCEFLDGDGLFTEADGRTPRFEQRAAAHGFDALLDYGGGNYLPQPSVFFSRALFQRVGQLDASLRYAMDLDLWLRMRAEVPLHCLPRRLSRLRQHDDSKTLRDNDRAMEEVTRVIRRHGQGRPTSVMRAVLSNMSRERARAQCSHALDAYFRRDRSGAWRGIWNASRHHPPIVLSRGFARVLLRVALPAAVKNRIFHNP